MYIHIFVYIYIYGLTLNLLPPIRRPLAQAQHLHLRLRGGEQGTGATHLSEAAQRVSAFLVAGLLL